MWDVTATCPKDLEVPDLTCRFFRHKYVKATRIPWTVWPGVAWRRRGGPWGGALGCDSLERTSEKATIIKR